MANHFRPPAGPHLRISEADRQLLERVFVADDPEAIEGLLAALPDGAKPTIRARYDLTGSGRAKVHCAHCHASRHYRGFIVDLEGGGVALIGINCGEGAFGFDWSGEVAKFEADLDRQLDLRRLAAVAPILPAFIAELEALDAARVAHAYPAFFHEVLKTGKAGQKIGRAVRDGGKMVVMEKVRNRAREEARARRENPWLLIDLENATTPADRERARRVLNQHIDAYYQEFDEIETVIGRLKHPELFQQGTNVAGLKTALALARKAHAAMEQDTGAHLDLGAIMRDVQAAVEGAKGAMDVLAALNEFASPENLKDVADWLNSYDEHNFRHSGRRISCTYAGKGFGVPDDWSVPATPALAQMLEALRGSAS